MSADNEPSEAFVKLCMTVSSFATACVSRMQGEGNDTANCMLHSLALFLATSGIADGCKSAEEFAAVLPDLVKKYAEAMHGGKSGN